MKITRQLRISLASIAIAFAGVLFGAPASAQFVHGLKPIPQVSAMSSKQILDLLARSKPAERLVDKPPYQVPATIRTMNVNTGLLPAMTSGDPGPTGGGERGGIGTGLGMQRGTTPVGPQTNEIAPQNYGSGNLNSIFHYNDYLSFAPTVYPWRTVGYFLFQAADSLWYHCTATLINRSILVTAGHCVHDGGNQAAGWILAGIFIPARAGGSAPYGTAYASHVLTTSGWYNTGSLDQGYDVGLVVLHKRSGTSTEMGAYTGWLGFCYAWCLQNYWFLTQIGYPGNYYSGLHMTVSQHIEMSDTKDYFYGTGMRGGSSGGPHVANIGQISDSSSDPGQHWRRNIVFAVTSWGYVSETPKQQGASSLSGPGNGNLFRNMYNWMCGVSRTLHGSGSCTNLP